MLASLVRTARPADWIKNILVLAPIPFALKAGASFEAAPFLLGLFGFCLINSAVYTLNDLFDLEADRLHPRKKHRPIAAGEVSPTVAAVQIVALTLIGLGMCMASARPAAIPVVLTYIVINLIYSAGLKHVALLDVFLLASGFVIRVLLGCILVQVVPSAWLLLCTSSLAFFVGFIKRRADLAAGVDDKHRPSLRGYSQAFLDQAITICAGMALFSYALYSVESEVFELESRKLASMPFVAYAVFDYLRLADVNNSGDSPVEIAFSSRSTQLCALGWIVAVTWSLGMW